MIQYKIKETIYQDKSSEFVAMYKKHLFWRHVTERDSWGDIYIPTRDSILDIMDVIRKDFTKYRKYHKTGAVYHDVRVSVDDKNNVVVTTY